MVVQTRRRDGIAVVAFPTRQPPDPASLGSRCPMRNGYGNSDSRKPPRRAGRRRPRAGGAKPGAKQGVPWRCGIRDEAMAILCQGDRRVRRQWAEPLGMETKTSQAKRKHPANPARQAGDRHNLPFPRRRIRGWKQGTGGGKLGV